MKNRFNLMTVSVVLLVFGLLFAGCDLGTGSGGSGGSGGVQINTIARDLANYREGEGPIATDEETALEFATVPGMLTVFAIEDSGMGNEFEDFGNFLDGWVNPEGNGDDEWWEESVQYPEEVGDSFISFAYSYSDTAISLGLDFDDYIYIDIPGLLDDWHIEAPSRLGGRGPTFETGTFRVQGDVEYNGVYVDGDQDSGEGAAFIRLDITDLDDEEGTTIHGGFIELFIEVDGSVFFDTEEIEGNVSATFIAANSLNAAFDGESSGKYVLQGSLNENFPRMSMDDAGDALFEAILETDVVLDVCNNAGEVLQSHTISLEDMIDVEDEL